MRSGKRRTRTARRCLRSVGHGVESGETLDEEREMLSQKRVAREGAETSSRELESLRAERESMESEYHRRGLSGGQLVWNGKRGVRIGRRRAETADGEG